ncbi:MAG: DUF7901 domain-containing protein, partial [Planctomycetota bacterium]
YAWGDGLYDVYEKYLADDWRCTQSGPITEITFWGSYLEDLRLGDGMLFNLAIFEDIPADVSPTGYSMPGKVLWSRYLRPDVEFQAFLANEEFFDPNARDVIGWDSEVWQYTFNFDAADAFQQTQGRTYWLGVNHSFDLNTDGVVGIADLYTFQGFRWAYGWKTSPDHWNDNAVFVDVDTFGTSGEVAPETGRWEELYDPRTGLPIDLSFELVTTSGPVDQFKWSQPPEVAGPDDLTLYDGWDEPSEYASNQIVADDWRCMTADPLAAVGWWGSFGGWYEPVEPPELPSAFHIGIWTDVPPDPVDPHQFFSHPGDMIWETTVWNYQMSFDGWVLDARDPMAPPQPEFYFFAELG